MISGDKKVKIKRYLFIDRNHEGFDFINPEDDEEIWGVPAGFDTENSLPYIIHMRGGTIIKSINCVDVSIIIFG